MEWTTRAGVERRRSCHARTDSGSCQRRATTAIYPNSYGAWGQAEPPTATGAAGDWPRPPMHFLSLTLGGEAMVGGGSVAKELQNMMRLRREPRDPDRVLARRMQPPEVSDRTSRRVFPLGFPPHASMRRPRQSFLTPNTCQGLGSSGAAGPAALERADGALAGPGQKQYEYEYERRCGTAGWGHLG